MMVSEGGQLAQPSRPDVDHLEISTPTTASSQRLLAKKQARGQQHQSPRVLQTVQRPGSLPPQQQQLRMPQREHLGLAARRLCRLRKS